MNEVPPMNSDGSLKVSVYIATSLDGYIARQDGDVSWLDAGEPLGEGEDAGYGDFMDSIDVLVMGRGSFEKVLEFDWPYGTKPVIVMSKSLKVVPENLRETVRIDSSTPPELIQKLSQEGFKHIYLDGGKLVQSFLREGLIDELTLTSIPVLIGEGRSLFGALDEDIRLQLLSSRSWENGFVQSRYRIVKKSLFGS
jgi:dihydrofolate reductase